MENITKGNSIFELADKTGAWKVKGPSTNYISGIVPKTISQTRQDIKTWTNAQNMAMVEENPKFFPIQNLFDNIMKDLHLQSQVNNRMLKSLSRPFSIKNADGKTILVNQSGWAGLSVGKIEFVFDRTRKSKDPIVVVNSL